ncbi:thioredoxin family protein [Candidatus Sumerlaeota bacterium]|nr:thioredoxin family protein [Candidatus Sumerlaeota bacterium]
MKRTFLLSAVLGSLIAVCSIVGVGTSSAWAADEDAPSAVVYDSANAEVETDAVQEAIALGWETDLDAALERARRSGKPVVEMFTTPWAPPGLAMAREVLSDERVRRALRSVETVVADPDASPERAGETKIEQLPTFVILDSDGKEYDRFGGFLPVGAFLATFEAAIDPKQAVSELVEQIARNPEDVQARWLLAKKYARDKNANDLKDTLDGIRKADPENREGYLDNAVYLDLMTALNPETPEKGVEAAERFLADFPKSEFAPEVEMTLAQLLYQAGDRERAIRLLEEFPGHYPDSPLAPQVAEDLRAMRAPTE